MRYRFESDLARPVIDWLKTQHWEVYQEVEPKRISRGIADIVAVSRGLVWVIECKTTMSLALLEQAITWKGFANFISIAIPAAKRSVKGHRAADMLLKHAGIGKITIDRYGYVRQVKQPPIHRHISPTLKDSLSDHQKSYAEAGNPNGHRWTPFQQTCSELLQVVKMNPGIHLKAAMDAVRHHYLSDSTARACISRYLQSENGGIVKGVRAERDGRFLRLYPE